MRPLAGSLRHRHRLRFADGRRAASPTVPAGDVIVDLEGDATSVQAEFAALKTAGDGHAWTAFGHAGHAGGEDRETSGGSPTTPSTPLTTPVRTLTYVVTERKCRSSVPSTHSTWMATVTWTTNWHRRWRLRGARHRRRG